MLTNTALASKWADMGGWSPLSALKCVNETKWLLDGIIPAGSINWMVASPSSFKTFVALDMATCIASARPWHGRETAGAVVLYVAGEGDSDIHVRRAAADMAADDTGPLCIVQMRPRLDEPHGLATLLALVNDITFTGDFGPGIDFPELQTYFVDSMEGYLTPDERIEFDALDEEGSNARDYGLRVSRPRFNAWDEAIAQVFEDMHLRFPGGINRKMAKNVFLIIDTYSQTSADDAKITVSRYIKTLRDLQEKAAALGGTITIMVVDHTTKSGESYMGSLAKLGDSDTMLEVERHGDSHAVTLKSLKMRSGPKFAPVHLSLTPFTLEGFTDASDRPLTSLIVKDGEHEHRIRQATGSSGDTAAALVLSLLTESGACTKSDLRLAFRSDESNKEKNTSSLSRAFNRTFARLTSDALILIDPEERVTIAPESPSEEQIDII